MQGKTGTRRAQSEFLQQNCRSRKRKTGVLSADLGFPRTSGQGQLSEFVSYRNNSIHAALHLVCSLYSDINTKEVVIFWSYVQLDDGTQFAYSETREDGTVRVAVERPVDFGFDHAECFLPAVKWFNVEGFTADDLNFLTEYVRSNAPLIFELAERQKAGPAVLALVP